MSIPVTLDDNFLPLPTQCTARAKSRLRLCTCKGDRSCDECRCRNKAIPGGSVCEFHGGKARQVVHAANDRIIAQLENLRDGAARLLEFWTQEQIDGYIKAVREGMPGPLLDAKMLTTILVALDNQYRINQGKATDITETRHVDAAELVRGLNERLDQIKLRNMGMLEDAEVVEKEDGE